MHRDTHTQTKFTVNKSTKEIEWNIKILNQFKNAGKDQTKGKQGYSVYLI